MFDDLRNDSEASEFADDEIDHLFEPKVKQERKRAQPRPGGKFLGMSAAQRFILSLLLLSVTCLGGFLTLLVMGRVALF
ncbi:MAG: hypothetical protein RBS68_10580 [Anaerolineales bacterium]|jgi:hypothetical protein|nr:hypothetical protein [Anaerolineales bacterium]